MIDGFLLALADYAVTKELIQPCDRVWALNRLLEVMELESIDPDAPVANAALPAILGELCDDAVRRGVIEEGIVSRDLFDTKLMGVLTPAPSLVRERFFSLYAEDPAKATDWFYRFSGDTNYIRRDRIARDMRWTYDCEYGTLDITVNLSKPEKDPKAIAAAKTKAPSSYPKCQLCAENEGYAGRLDHPARQNHRILPFRVAGSDWFFQYSPYVYYNEHCIVFNGEHVPMKIDRACFAKLLSFVSAMPHYFLGSNADLPIVGGSILTHDHFQGGHYEFAMASAAVERTVSFTGYEDVEAGIVKWPLSVIRLRHTDPDRLADLADRILRTWREHSDEAVSIRAFTGDVPHNTITPIARFKDGKFEMDLVLRNNRTTDERPAGLFHPREEYHHIKRENIGLIEVMGLAVLPARLKKEIGLVRDLLLEGGDLRAVPETAIHADWAQEIARRRRLTEDNIDGILREEIGRVFMQVLTDAGVYKRTAEGREAFLRFIDTVNRKEN